MGRNQGGLRWLKGSILVIIYLSLLFWTGKYVLSFSELSYRAWADLTGKLLSLLLLPLLLLLLTGFGLHFARKTGKILLMIVLTFGYLIWGCIVLLALVFTVHGEVKIAPNLLVSNEAEFLGENVYVYYRPVLFFLREPGELTETDKAEYLSEKYGRKFAVREKAASDSTEEAEKQIYELTRPGVPITAERIQMELTDNYVEVLTAELLMRGIEELGIDREYRIAEDYRGNPGWLYLELHTEEEIPDFARDASALITYLTERTDFYQKQRAVFGYYLETESGEVIGSFPFGKLSVWDRITQEEYQDPVLLAALIEAGVKGEKESTVAEQTDSDAPETGVPEMGGIPETAWDITDSSDLSEQWAEFEEVFEGVMRVENAAMLIYDTMLADQGYSCEVCFSAKGNLYLDLGETVPVRNEGGTEEILHYTLVYDRTSANGACELFVLYRDHLELDASGGRTVIYTEIVDMYAAETETGKVVLSGKKIWSDPGTEEYRQLTGE